MIERPSHSQRGGRAGIPARLALPLVAAGLGGITALAQAEPADPFSTGTLVAHSQAASTDQSRLSLPCAEMPANRPELGLADVVEAALCNNPQTREAWANARYQAAQVGAARAAYLPTLNASAAASRNRIDGGASASATGSYSQESLGLSLSYVLYDFGARDAALESARQLLAAANASQDAIIQSVFLAAVQGYYQFLATSAAVESARVAEKSARESFAAAQARYNLGAATPADKLQAQTALSQAVLNRIKAEGDANTAQGVLANSMGLDANRSFRLAAIHVTAPDGRFQRDVAGLIEEARRRRPDLAAAEAQLRSAKAGVNSARAAGMPTLSLGASVSRSDTSGTDPVNSSSLGLTLSVPLFTGYANTYGVRAAEAQVETRLAQRERLSQQVALDVWKAYQSLATESQAVESSADLVSSAAQSEQVALGRYKAGVGNILDLLSAQAALASARLQNIQSLYNWRMAKAALAQAMGRLDLAEMAPPAAGKPTP